MIAVDTNVVSGLLRGQLQYDIDTHLYIPYVVIAELKAGAAFGASQSKTLSKLQDFFSTSDVSTSAGINTEVLDVYVGIYAHLRKSGTPVSPNDMWIAAECLALDLPLLTLDSDFKRIKDLMLVEV